MRLMVMVVVLVMNLDSRKYTSWIAYASICIGWRVESCDHNVIFTPLKKRLDMKCSAWIVESQGVLRFINKHWYPINEHDGIVING